MGEECGGSLNRLLHYVCHLQKKLGSLWAAFLPQLTVSAPAAALEGSFREDLWSRGTSPFHYGHHHRLRTDVAKEQFENRRGERREELEKENGSK